MEARRTEIGLYIRVDYPDEDLTKRIESFLRSRHFSSLRNLDVHVNAGIATLRGEVSSFYEKQVALDSCRRVAGVLCTVDQMRVEQRGESDPSVVARQVIKSGSIEPIGGTARLEVPAQTGVSSF